MRIVFIGTGEIGVPTLRALLKSAEHELAAVVTQPDKPVGTRPANRGAADQRRRSPEPTTPILQPARIRDPAIDRTRFARSQPDVIVVMAYGQILPRAVLEIPPIACLNLHASLLPRWRGAAPIQAAIAAGDRETGITVMYMDEGLDTGDILLQRKIDISPDETGGSLHDRLAQIAPEALLESLRLLGSGKRPARSARQCAGHQRAKTESRRRTNRLVGTGGSDRAKNSRLQSMARRVYADIDKAKRTPEI